MSNITFDQKVMELKQQQEKIEKELASLEKQDAENKKEKERAHFNFKLEKNDFPSSGEIMFTSTVDISKNIINHIMLQLFKNDYHGCNIFVKNDAVIGYTMSLTLYFKILPKQCYNEKCAFNSYDYIKSKENNITERIKILFSETSLPVGPKVFITDYGKDILCKFIAGNHSQEDTDKIDWTKYITTVSHNNGVFVCLKNVDILKFLKEYYGAYKNGSKLYYLPIVKNAMFNQYQAIENWFVVILRINEKLQDESARKLGVIVKDDNLDIVTV